MITDPAFCLAAVPVVIRLGLAKGGFAGLVIVGMSLLALVINPVRAAAIMLPILIVQDAVSLWAYRKTFDWEALGILAPGAIVGVVIGAVTAAYVSEAAALTPLAVVATLAGVWLIRRLPVERFYAIIYGLLLMVGAKLTYDGIVIIFGSAAP